MVHTRRTTEGLHTSIGHMHKHRSQIDRQCQTVELQRLESLDTATIEPQVSSIISELSGAPVGAAVAVFQKFYSNIKNIVSGSVDVLDILLADEALANLYVYADQFAMSQNPLDTSLTPSPTSWCSNWRWNRRLYRQSEDVDTWRKCPILKVHLQ